MKTLLLSVAFLPVVFLTGLLAPYSVSGTAISYNISGTLDSISGDELALDNWNSDVKAKVGDSFSGTLTYNPDAQAFDTGSNQLAYNAFTYSIHIGKLVVSSSDPIAVQTYITKGSNVSEMNFWDIVPASNVPSIFVDDMNMEALYSKVIATNGNLPKNLFVNYITSMGFFATGNGAPLEGIEGPDFGMTVTSITPVTVAPVPEPASVLLILTGIIGLFGFKKKMRRE